jgi:hypothetical protein
MALSYIGKFKQSAGQLIAESKGDKRLYEEFRKNVPEGAIVSVFMDVHDPNEKSLGQLAKVHKQIRELAAFTGNTFDEMKKEVKRKAGFAIGEWYSSFEYHSKDEINLAIQAATEIGEIVGCYVG